MCFCAFCSYPFLFKITSDAVRSFQIGFDFQAYLFVRFRQNADDVRRVFFDAFAFPVSLKFVGNRNVLADADERVMPAVIAVGFAF